MYFLCGDLSDNFIGKKLSGGCTSLNNLFSGWWIIMKLRPFVISFIVLWLLSALITIGFGDMAKAGNFGDSFGAINALFSGIALALAIYSMILQQRQNAEFEQKTLATMAQQAEVLDLIKTGLVQQANVARVTALTYLIEREEQRIETLKVWGL
jgi:hypothetical protein